VDKGTRCSMLIMSFTGTFDMKSKPESSEEDRLKAEYSARYRDPFALNLRVSLILVSLCLAIMEDFLSPSPLHGPRLWGYWAALFGVVAFSAAGGKHEGRLGGYVDGHADGKKSAGLS
jgi:hypothetical protein